MISIPSRTGNSLAFPWVSLCRRKPPRRSAGKWCKISVLGKKGYPF